MAVQLGILLDRPDLRAGLKQGRGQGAEARTHLDHRVPGRNLGQRELRWKAFATDPDWLTAKAATEADGQIVANIANSFLQPTAFSAVQ